MTEYVCFPLGSTAPSGGVQDIVNALKQFMPFAFQLAILLAILYAVKVIFRR